MIHVSLKVSEFRPYSKFKLMSVCLLCINWQPATTHLSDIVCQPISPHLITKVRGKSIEFGARFLKWLHIPFSSQSSFGWYCLPSTWLGVAEGATLNLDFGVKKCPNQKNYFWDVYLCVMELPKPKTPCRPHRHFNLELPVAFPLLICCS